MAQQYITIPIPVKLERNRGVDNLGTHGHQTTVRMHEDMYNQLRLLSAKMGLKPGEFIRFVVVYSMREIIKLETGKDVEVHL